MEWKRAASVTLFVSLMLFSYGCAYVGPTTGTDHAFVQGGKAYIRVSHPRGLGACQCGHWG